MKRKIGVWIPHGDVWDEFIDVVKAKWGKKHSVVGLELEEAIKAYIEKSSTWGKDEIERRLSELKSTMYNESPEV